MLTLLIRLTRAGMQGRDTMFIPSSGVILTRPLVPSACLPLHLTFFFQVSKRPMVWRKKSRSRRSRRRRWWCFLVDFLSLESGLAGESCCEYVFVMLGGIHFDFRSRSWSEKKRKKIYRWKMLAC